VTAAQAVAEARRHGCRLKLEDGRPVLYGRPGSLPEPILDTLKANRESVAALLATEEPPAPLPEVARVSLYQLDKVLEIVVPWSDQTLFLAPGCRVARQLAERYGQNHVRCVCAVLDFFLRGDAPAILEAARLFDGRIDGRAAWEACASKASKAADH
jgi:hypothetical protein